MTKFAELYVTLLLMQDAAAEHSQKKVVALNKVFQPAYARLNPEGYKPGSWPYLYDQARNSLINVVQEKLTPGQKEAELRKAKKFISRIEESGNC
jgi:hypothetical protein